MYSTIRMRFAMLTCMRASLFTICLGQASKVIEHLSVQSRRTTLTSVDEGHNEDCGEADGTAEAEVPAAELAAANQCAVNLLRASTLVEEITPPSGARPPYRPRSDQHLMRCCLSNDVLLSYVTEGLHKFSVSP